MDVTAVSATQFMPGYQQANDLPAEPFSRAAEASTIRRFVMPRPPIPIGSSEPFKVPPPEGRTLYAEIKDSAGKVLAKVFNSGLAEVPDDFKGLDGLATDLEGPALAEARARELARALGGSIEPSPTALAQEAWNALPVVWQKSPPFDSASLSMLHEPINPPGKSDDDPSNLYAEVVKDGLVVAKLYNGGSAVTYAGHVIDGKNEPYRDGPDLAQWRAEKIAATLGGAIRRADTAQDDASWRSERKAQAASAQRASYAVTIEKAASTAPGMSISV